MTGPERTEALDDLALRVINPYAIMAGALVILALFVRFSPLPDNVSEDEATHASGADRGSVMAYPQLVLGAVALFFYVGAEVIAGDAIGLYGQSQGIPLSETKNFTSWTLGAMLVGYVIGILTIPKYITQARALMVSSVAGIALACAAMLTSGYTSVLCIALLGLANALMWPAIWPLAIEGLGKYTKTGSALLIMGIVGGAVLTPMFGALSDSPAVGSRMALLIFMPCYLFIGWYAVKGHKLRSWS